MCGHGSFSYAFHCHPSYLLLPISSQRTPRNWKYISWRYSHSCLKVKYSVRCLHSWLPLRRNNVLGYRIFKTHKYKTHCKRKCFQWIFLIFYLTKLIFASFLLTILTLQILFLFIIALFLNKYKLYEIRLCCITASPRKISSK